MIYIIFCMTYGTHNIQLLIEQNNISKQFENADLIISNLA